MNLLINEESTNSNGTCLQGYITIPYSELVKKLGAGNGSGDKTLDEWVIEGELNGEMVVATIYDWKNYGFNVENITHWHIGGFNKDAVRLVKSIFPNRTTQYA